MAPPERTSDCSLLLIYRPRNDERLIWPSWLTCSGQFTAQVVTRQKQVERRTGKVRRPKTDDLPLCHATNRAKQALFSISLWYLCMCLSAQKLINYWIDIDVTCYEYGELQKWLKFGDLHLDLWPWILFSYFWQENRL